MSLIVGLHLLERFYLVSDTRATTTKSGSGIVVVKDNLIKTFKFNNRISALAAGGALPASFMLNKLRTKITEDTTISELRIVIDDELRAIISDYVNTTGYHSGKVAFIIAGFDNGTGKDIEVASLGNAMSAMVVKGGIGTFTQSFDNRLLKVMGSLGGKKKGDHITVPDVSKSAMFAIEIDIRTADIKITSVDCYQYAIFHPKQSIETVPVPEELLSRIEFRNRTGKTGETQLYEEAQELINFVRRTSKKYEFWTVGGHIMVLLQTPTGNAFPTGDFGTIKEGKVVKVGSFFVKDGKLMYEQEDGTKGEYRHIESIYGDYLANKEENAYLSELLL